MKILGIALDMKNDKATMNDKPLILTTTAVEPAEVIQVDDNDESDDEDFYCLIHQCHIVIMAHRKNTKEKYSEWW